MRDYVVRYETNEGVFEFEIEADGYASAATLVFMNTATKKAMRKSQLLRSSK